MRISTVILCGFLAACATPQNDKSSYWGKTYAPGQAISELDGRFTSTATVTEAADLPVARRAAFGRLMQNAQRHGYSYFRLKQENQSWAFGHKITLSGDLHYEQVPGAMPIEAIGNLLKGMPLDEPLVDDLPDEGEISQKLQGQTQKPIAAVPQTMPAIAAPASSTKTASAGMEPTDQRAASLMIIPASRIEDENAPVRLVPKVEIASDETDADIVPLPEKRKKKPVLKVKKAKTTKKLSAAKKAKKSKPVKKVTKVKKKIKKTDNDPLVVMAPVDITGSTRKKVNILQVITGAGGEGVVNTELPELPQPKALRHTPTGVIIK